MGGAGSWGAGWFPDSAGPEVRSGFGKPEQESKDVETEMRTRLLLGGSSFVH